MQHAAKVSDEADIKESEVASFGPRVARPALTHKAELLSNPWNGFFTGAESILCGSVEKRMLETQVRIGVGSSQAISLEDAVREAMGAALRGLEEHAPHWIFVTATENYNADGGLCAIVSLCKEIIVRYCASGGGTDAAVAETLFHATTTCRAVLNSKQGLVSGSPLTGHESRGNSALGIFCIWNPRHVLEASRPYIAAGNFAVVSCDQDEATRKEADRHFYGNVKKAKISLLKKTLIEQATIESRRDNAKRLLAYDQSDVGRYVDIWFEHTKKRGRVVRFEKRGDHIGLHSIMFGKQLRDIEDLRMESVRFVIVQSDELSFVESKQLEQLDYNTEEKMDIEYTEEQEQNGLASSSGEAENNTSNTITTVLQVIAKDVEGNRSHGINGDDNDSGGQEIWSFLHEADLSDFFSAIRGHDVRSCAELFDPDVIDTTFLASKDVGMAPNQIEQFINAMERQLLADTVLWVSTTPGLEQDILDIISSVLPHSVNVVGGTAADNDISGRWGVCCGEDTEIIKHGFVVSGLQLNLEMKSIFLNTYVPVPNSEGKVLHRSPNKDVFHSNKSDAGKEKETIIESIDDGSEHTDAARVYQQWVRNFTGSSDILPEVSSVRSQVDTRTTLRKTAVHPLGLRVARSGDPNVDFVNIWPCALYRHVDGPGAVESKKSAEVIDTGMQWTKVRSLLDSVTLMQATESSCTNLGEGITKALNRNERHTPQPMGTLMAYSGGALQNMMQNFRGTVIDDLCYSLNSSLYGSPFLSQFSYGEQGFHSGCYKMMHSNLMASALIFLQRPRATAQGDLDEALTRAMHYVSSDQGRSMCKMIGFSHADMHLAIRALRIFGSKDCVPLELSHVEAFLLCFGIDMLEEVLLSSINVLGRSLEIAPHLHALAKKEPHRRKWYTAQAERIGSLSKRLVEILCEVYGDADTMWVLCTDPCFSFLNVDEGCKEHENFISSRIVQELVDECLSVGDIFYGKPFDGKRSSIEEASTRNFSCLTPRESFLFRLVAHIVATALLAFGSLSVAGNPSLATSTVNFYEQRYSAFLLGTLIATAVTSEDAFMSLGGWDRYKVIGCLVSIPRFRYNKSYIIVQCLSSIEMVYACIMGQAPIATSVVLLLQMVVLGKYTALHNITGPLQIRLLLLLREVVAIFALLALVTTAFALALVSLNAPEHAAPYQFQSFLPCVKALAGSAILGDAGVFEAGNEHHGSALLLLPDREDYADGFRHTLVLIYLYSFFGVVSTMVLNLLLSIFCVSKEEGEIPSHVRRFRVKRWFYAMDYKLRLFSKPGTGRGLDYGRNPSSVIDAAAAHMADGNNRNVSLAVAVRELKRPEVRKHMPGAGAGRKET